MSDTKKISFNTTELNDRMSFRVNSNILKEFTKIAEEQGFNPSLVLRKYMESVVKSSDKQQKLF